MRQLRVLGDRCRLHGDASPLKVLPLLVPPPVLPQGCECWWLPLVAEGAAGEGVGVLPAIRGGEQPGELAAGSQRRQRTWAAAQRWSDWGCSAEALFTCSAGL